MRSCVEKFDSVTMEPCEADCYSLGFYWDGDSGCKDTQRTFTFCINCRGPHFTCATHQPELRICAPVTCMDCKGENFHKPQCVASGKRKRVYLNAYGVTRHFGGQAEGGWWFNAGAPLASIPFEGWEDEQGVIHPVDDSHFNLLAEILRKELADVPWGNIYHSTGGVELEISLQDHMAESWPNRQPMYE